DTHGVAGGVQRVRADDQGGHVVVVLAGVPAAVLAAAVEQQQAAYVEAAHPGDAVLAVGREHEVPRAQRARGTDLRGLLAEARRPPPELARALQGRRLAVEAASQRHVAVETRERRAVQVVRAGRVHPVVHALAGGREQLYGVVRG